jgi:neutral ceramidase
MAEHPSCRGGRSRITLRRSAPIPADGLRNAAGAAEADLTPPVGIPMAGYSWTGRVARGWRGRLRARALVLADAQGWRVALCALDLMSCSRYLLERVAQRTARTAGLGVDRLILAGTHTHTAPGNYYGAALFDQMAQKGMGFDAAVADWLADRVAEAIERAVARLEPALVAVRERRLWGTSRSRSLAAFRCNPLRWDAPGMPGEGAPGDGPAAAIDPRVRVLAARGADGRPIGVFATFGCHATAFGQEEDRYCPDWPGIAAVVARERLADLGGTPVVGVAQAAAGDATPLPVDAAAGAQGEALARRVGGAVGAAVADAARDALTAPDAAPVDFQLCFGEYGVHDRKTFVDDPSTRLAEQWWAGAPALGGAEDGRSFLFKSGAVREGMRHTGPEGFPRTHPQFPKARSFGPLAETVRTILRLAAPPVAPVHVLVVDGHAFGTVPGETTTAAAWQLEEALRAATGAARASVITYAGDYHGYFTTGEEFDAQHYEGAQMLWGANATRWLAAALAETVARPQQAGTETVCFPTVRAAREWLPARRPSARRARVTAMQREGDQLSVHFELPGRASLFPADGFVLRLEWDDGAPARIDGRDIADDALGLPITVTRTGGPVARPVFATRWTARLPLPAPTPGRLLFLVLADRWEFRGHRVVVPA